ncbi:MAG: glycosyltransferase family 9 protein [Deltaproteobacteria bacterium]|nr:glycosyltransferase family 9 protein [Deltaproteobacteria bacterium]
MNWKIEFLKRFDSAFGGVACSLSKVIVEPRKEVDEHRPKILVIRPGGIGDAALLYPALKLLRESYKYAEINFLAEKRNAGILTGCPYINNLFLYDFRPPLELFKILRTDYDIVIDTEQWHRMTSALSFLTKAPIRAGFATNERAELYTHPVFYSHDDYEVYSFLNLVSAVTGKQYDFNESEPFIPLDSNLISGVMHSIVEFGKKWRALMGVFAGATIAERRWGINRFAELAKSLLGEDVGIVIVGGKSDIKDAKSFEEIVGTENILSFVGKTSLMETAAIISKLDLFVTGDTGLMHVAYGVGTPTVSLFGAGIQRKWAPIEKRHVVINKNLPCSPCTKFGYTPKCPFNVKCLNDITVEDVKESVLRLLSQSEK